VGGSSPRTASGHRGEARKTRAAGPRLSPHKTKKGAHPRIIWEFHWRISGSLSSAARLIGPDPRISFRLGRVSRTSGASNESLRTRPQKPSNSAGGRVARLEGQYPG
jgi:hypothetical protein